MKYNILPTRRWHQHLVGIKVFLTRVGTNCKLAGAGVHYNAQMNTKQIRAYCKLDDASKQLLKTAMKRLNLSARAYDRILNITFLRYKCITYLLSVFLNTGWSGRWAVINHTHCYLL